MKRICKALIALLVLSLVPAGCAKDTRPYFIDDYIHCLDAHETHDHALADAHCRKQAQDEFAAPWHHGHHRH